MPTRRAWRSCLPQGGEFGFVLFTAAVSLAIMPQEVATFLIALVTVTMALTPLSMRLAEWLAPPPEEEEMDEDFDGAGSDVLLIGFSRFGQIASQILLTEGTDVTIIDHSARRVHSVQEFGFRIYYGDGRRKDVLDAAGIRQARIVAICTNERETTDRIVDLILSDYPHVRLFVRSYDRAHAISLRARGVEFEIRETFESALGFGRETLERSAPRMSMRWPWPTRCASVTRSGWRSRWRAAPIRPRSRRSRCSGR